MSAPFIFKIVIIVLLVLILLSLAGGMVFLVKDKGQGNRTLGSLAVRITLSIVLFVLLLVGYRAGWIRPHGIIPPQMENPVPQKENDT